MFGADLIQAFREFKAAWDPLWRMNSGKIIDRDRSMPTFGSGAKWGQSSPGAICRNAQAARSATSIAFTHCKPFALSFCNTSEQIDRAPIAEML